MKVYKIYDDDCDICKHMSKHDQSTFEGFPDLKFEEVDLNEVVQPNTSSRPITMTQLYRCVETHALNPDYTIDLPVYVFLDNTGSFEGHLQGALTVQELKEGVKNIFSKTTPEGS